jgi:hypothetical protein
MNSTGPRFQMLATAVLLAAPTVVAGCAAHVTYGYRVYDPVYGDYHVYDRNEEVYYNQWVAETHRPHRDFRKMSDSDRKDYWKWRHEHH